MDLRKLKKLIDLVEDSSISELEITEGEERVRISKSGTGIPAHAVPTVAAPAVISVPETKSLGKVEEELPAGHVVNSPMVGTFYRSPEPGSDVFVNENDKVVPGQTLCIIEAMKLMNPIQSEIKGRVVEILVENAQPVEYGQTIIIVE